MNEDRRMSRGSKSAVCAVIVARSACFTALGLSVACQQAKGDDVATGSNLPPPAVVEGDSDGGVAPSANDAGRAGVDIERPGSIANEPDPAASDAAVVGGLPSDPLAVAASFPIVFRSRRSAENTTELYVMHADGSEPQRLTRGGEFFLPRWSPDGSRIVFRRVDPNGAAIADVGVVSPNGAELTMLTSNENYNFFDLPATWSPDGQRILFGSTIPNEGVWLFEIAPSGGQRERLLPDVLAFQREAALSPVDPTRLAYVEGDEVALSNAIRIIDADNPGAGLDISTGRAGRPQHPRWSPDGTRLVFAGFELNPDGTIKGISATTPTDGGVLHIPNLDLFLLELATGEVTQLTSTPGSDYEPAWSPDGSQILFTSERDGDDDLWLMPVSDPSQAVNLIDDNLDRKLDGGADWYAPPTSASLAPR
jgi:dipeptidyl aminopeptidase/acylaminoacyl peptidase